MIKIRKILSVAFFLLFLSVVNAQEVMIPDFDNIKQIIFDDGSPYFYETLLNRFNSLDSTLTDYEYHLLYYGFIFDENYIKNKPKEDSLSYFASEDNFEKIIQEASKILKYNPFSLLANYEMGYSIYQTDPNNKEWERYRDHYYGIRKVIAYSGNGLSAETSFVVIHIEDEYSMIYDYFDIPGIKEQECCDIFHITPSGRFNAEKIYFNISSKLMRQQNLLDDN